MPDKEGKGRRGGGTRTRWGTRQVIFWDDNRCWNAVRNDPFHAGASVYLWYGHDGNDARWWPVVLVKEQTTNPGIWSMQFKSGEVASGVNVQDKDLVAEVWEARVYRHMGQKMSIELREPRVPFSPTSNTGGASTDKIEDLVTMQWSCHHHRAVFMSSSCMPSSCHRYDHGTTRRVSCCCKMMFSKP